MKIAILLLFVFIHLLNYAQEEISRELKFGAAEKAKPQYVTEQIGVLNNEVYILAKSFSKTYIMVYDSKSLIRKEYSKLKLNYQKNKLKLENTLIYANRVVFITSYINKTSNLKYFFLHTYEGSGEISSPQVIGKTDWSNAPGSFSLSAKKVESSFAFKMCISPDKKGLAFIYPDKINQKEEEDNGWHVSKFDDNLKLEWSFDIKLRDPDVYLNKIVLSDEGKLYAAGVKNSKVADRELLVYYDKGGMRFTNCLTGENYFLVIIDGKANKMNEIDLGLQNTDIISLNLNVLNNRVYFYGITQNKETGTHSFLVTLDSSGTELNQSKNPINPEMMLVEQNGEKDVKKFESKNVKFKKYFLRDINLINGNLVFITEAFDYYETHHAAGPNAGTTTIPHYVYGNLMIFGYNAEGIYQWSGFYRKYQNVSNFKKGSFSSYVLGDKLYLLLLNDEYSVNKEDLSKGEKFKAKRNDVLAYVEIQGDGTIKDDILINEDEMKRYSLDARYGFVYDNFIYFSSQHYESVFKAMPCLGALKIGS